MRVRMRQNRGEQERHISDAIWTGRLSGFSHIESIDIDVGCGGGDRGTADGVMSERDLAKIRA